MQKRLLAGWWVVVLVLDGGWWWRPRPSWRCWRAGGLPVRPGSAEQTSRCSDGGASGGPDHLLAVARSEWGEGVVPLLVGSRQRWVPSHTSC